MRDLVSDRRRGRYFGYRTRRTTITSFVALVAGGALLHAFDASGSTYAGFVVVFTIAMVGLFYDFIGRTPPEVDRMAAGEAASRPDASVLPLGDGK